MFGASFPSHAGGLSNLKLDSVKFNSKLRHKSFKWDLNVLKVFTAKFCKTLIFLYSLIAAVSNKGRGTEEMLGIMEYEQVTRQEC